MEPKQKVEPFHLVFIIISLVFYLLGRLCDDMSWHQFSGLSSTGFQGISMASLAASAIITIILRLSEEDGHKIIFFRSQVKFIIPWALVITESILVFRIFGCFNEIPADASFVDMEYNGCVLYVLTMLLTNLNYSLICNDRGHIISLIVFMMVLFGEIVYSGILLVTFIEHLENKPKDYSILFVSIMIAWQIHVMDLMFRCAYEEKEKDMHIKKIHKMVLKHHEKWMEGRSVQSQGRLNPLELEVVPAHSGHRAGEGRASDVLGSLENI